MITEGDKIILEKEDKIHKMISKKINREEKGWNALAKKSFEEVWDNEKDEETWSKYL